MSTLKVESLRHYDADSDALTLSSSGTITFNGTLVGVTDSAQVQAQIDSAAVTLTGNQTITGAKTFVGTTSTPAITLNANDNTSGAAPIMEFVRQTAQANNGDYLGQIKFRGEDSDGADEIYAKITGKIADPTNATEDGLIEYAVVSGGSNKILARMTGNSGGKFILENSTALEVTGDATIDGNVGIGSSPLTKLYVSGTGDQTTSEVRAENTSTTQNGRGIVRVKSNTSTYGAGIFATNNDETAYGNNVFGLYTFDDQPLVIGTNNTERMRIDSSGNVGIGTTSPDTKLQVSGNILADEYQWNAGTGRRVSKYSGISSYWNQNEYIELFTVTPNGASQNYFVEGCIKAQASHSMDILRFSVSVRSNTLPTLVYYAAYDRERMGTDFGLKPYIWYDTTNGVIKVAVKNTSSAGIHNAEFELNISARNTAQSRDNVSYSGAERAAVTSGFTEYDTFILRKNSYVNDTYYFERHEQRPHLHGTPYGTDGQVATGMRVRQSNQLSFVTDRITVPIAGIYLITFNSLSSNANTSRTDLNIRVNGSTVSADLDMGIGSNDYSGKSTQVAVDLAANDYIQFFNTDWYVNSPSGFDNWQQVSITYIG